MDAAATKAQILAYYESQGIDPATVEPYLDELDDLESIDPDELSTEEWEMYMKLTLFKLWAILYPDSFQSYYAMVGDELTAENVYEYMPADILAELSEDIYDDPMLMALFSPEVEDMLEDADTSSDYSWEGSDDSLSYWGMDPNLYYLLTETQEGYEATMSSLMGEYYENQEAKKYYTELHTTGEISDYEYEMWIDMLDQDAQLLISRITGEFQSYQQVLELAATMVDKQNDLAAQLAANLKIA